MISRLRFFEWMIKRNISITPYMYVTKLTDMTTKEHFWVIVDLTSKAVVFAFEQRKDT